MSAPVQAPGRVPQRGEPGWRLPSHSDDPSRGVRDDRSGTSPLLALVLVLLAAAAILVASWVLGGGLQGSPDAGPLPPSARTAPAAPATSREPASSALPSATATATATPTPTPTLPTASAPSVPVVAASTAAGPGGDLGQTVVLVAAAPGALRYAVACPAGSSGGSLVVLDAGAPIVEDAGTSLGGMVPFAAGTHRLEVQSTCPWTLAVVPG